MKSEYIITNNLKPRESIRWLIGDFSPSLFKSKDIEIGHIKLLNGHKSDGHFHKKHTEYNYVVNGIVKINNKIFREGDCFIYEPGDKSEGECLSDVNLIVIKIPATKNDKYY